MFYSFFFFFFRKAVFWARQAGCLFFLDKKEVGESESESERERERESERGIVEMEQGGQQGGNGGQNPATGNAPRGPGPDLASRQPHRGNKIKKKVVTGLVSDVIKVVSNATGGN